MYKFPTVESFRTKIKNAVRLEFRMQIDDCEAQVEQSAKLLEAAKSRLEVAKKQANDLESEMQHYVGLLEGVRRDLQTLPSRTSEAEAKRDEIKSRRDDYLLAVADFDIEIEMASNALSELEEPQDHTNYELRKKEYDSRVAGLESEARRKKEGTKALQARVEKAQRAYDEMKRKGERTDWNPQDGESHIAASARQSAFERSLDDLRDEVRAARHHLESNSSEVESLLSQARTLQEPQKDQEFESRMTDYLWRHNSLMSKIQELREGRAALGSVSQFDDEAERNRNELEFLKQQPVELANYIAKYEARIADLKAPLEDSRGKAADKSEVEDAAAKLAQAKQSQDRLEAKITQETMLRLEKFNELEVSRSGLIEFLSSRTILAEQSERYWSDLWTREINKHAEKSSGDKIRLLEETKTQTEERIQELKDLRPTEDDLAGLRLLSEGEFQTIKRKGTVVRGVPGRYTVSGALSIAAKWGFSSFIVIGPILSIKFPDLHNFSAVVPLVGLMLAVTAVLFFVLLMLPITKYLRFGKDSTEYLAYERAQEKKNNFENKVKEYGGDENQLEQQLSEVNLQIEQIRSDASKAAVAQFGADSPTVWPLRVNPDAEAQIGSWVQGFDPLNLETFDRSVPFVKKFVEYVPLEGELMPLSTEWKKGCDTRFAGLFDECTHK